MRDGRCNEQTEARQFTRRALGLGAGQVAIFAGLAARLYQLQVLEGTATAALAQGNRTRQIAIPPRRGRILDATGEVLTVNREAFRVVLQPRRVLDAGELRDELRRLAPLVGIDRDEQERLLLVAARYGRERPLLIAGNLTFDQVAALEVHSLEFPFVSVESTWARTFAEGLGTKASAMAHIAGTVGAVERAALDDDPVLRVSDMRIGKTGVEAGMERELRGIAGSAVVEVDAHGRQVRLLRETAPREGRDVMLAVDAGQQAHVMERLAQDKHQGCVVAIDVATGEVRLMASLPTYDPLALTGAQSRAAWVALSADNTHPLLNRAIAGLYPPGSTFKLVTALAALKAAVLDPKEKIECWGDVTIAGHLFRCWNRKGHKVSDLHKGLRESCDCYFYEAARRTGMDAIAGMAHELGLGQTFNAGIAQQKAGLIPSRSWKRFHSRTGWLIGETLLSGIGQGYVQATPLQLAVMAARVATGRAVVPTLLKHNKARPAPEFAALDIPPAALAAVRRGMVAVVNEPGGTGQSAGFDEGEVLVAGKTGTSQVTAVSADHDLNRAVKMSERDHAVFVAYAPASAPRYAIAVLLEHGGGGGANAGPVVRDCLKLLLDQDAARAKTPAAMGRSSAGAGPNAVTGAPG